MNGDTWHDPASKKNVSKAQLDVVQEDQVLDVSSVEHMPDKELAPWDKPGGMSPSGEMFLPVRTTHRKKVIKKVPAVKVPKSPFERSDDWKLQFDLQPQDGCDAEECKPKIPFPPHIAAVSKRPDGVMWSDKLKMVMWIELTSPWEENMNHWYFEKHSNYRKIVEAAEGNDWKVVPLCVEIGA